MSRFLVTGGAGFIGSHIAEALVGRGHEVRVYDDFSAGREENLRSVWDRIEVQRGDVRDRFALRKAVARVDGILHEAAMVSTARSMQFPEECHEVNLTGALNVLLEAQTAGVKRVVLAYSSAVYGDSPDAAREESPVQPMTPYAASKLGAEAYGQAFGFACGLEVVSLRYFNVYGPRQDPSSEYSGVIARFAQALMAQEAGIVYGDGTQTRDFVYVEDVVRANLMACEAPDLGGRTFNIGTGQPVRIIDLYRRMSALCGLTGTPRFGPARQGDILHSCCSPVRAEKQLGFRAKVRLEEGLGRTLAWYGLDPSRGLR